MVLRADTITDISKLVVGQKYVVLTGEPHGEFHVGAFLGWLFPEDVEMRFVLKAELPEGWDTHYPDLSFEHATVGDYYMFEGYVDD